MAIAYFTADNTDGFSPREIDLMNATVEAILHLWRSGPGSPNHEDDVKNACDMASNAFPFAPDIL